MCVLLLANAEKICGGGKQTWATCVFPWTQSMGGMLRGPVCQVLLPSGDFSSSKTSKPTSRINLCTLMRCVWLTYEWRLTLSFSPIYNWRTSVLYLHSSSLMQRCGLQVQIQERPVPRWPQAWQVPPLDSCLWMHTLWTLKPFCFNLPRSSHPSPTGSTQVGTQFSFLIHRNLLRNVILH